MMINVCNPNQGSSHTQTRTHTHTHLQALHLVGHPDGAVPAPADVHAGHTKGIPGRRVRESEMKGWHHRLFECCAHTEHVCCMSRWHRCVQRRHTHTPRQVEAVVTCVQDDEREEAVQHGRHLLSVHLVQVADDLWVTCVVVRCVCLAHSCALQSEERVQAPHLSAVQAHHTPLPAQCQWHAPTAHARACCVCCWCTHANAPVHLTGL